MRLSLYEFQTGAETAGGNRVVYDVANDAAYFGAAHVEGHALVWQLDDTPEEAEGALLSRRVQLDPLRRPGRRGPSEASEADRVPRAPVAPRMRAGGKLLVDQLAVHGVELAFGVPGESCLAVLDALHDAPIRFVSCRHEVGASNMADAYGHMFGPMAKWVAQIESADRIPELVSRAFHVATAGRPGPVVLALPEDMLVEESAAADALPGLHRQPPPHGSTGRARHG